MTQDYINRICNIIFQAIDGYDTNTYPAFHEALHTHFPGALPLSQYMQLTVQALVPYNFYDENTMGMVAICRDEIAEPMLEEVIRYWGKTFNCCSLGGFLTIGKTGLAAATNHAPLFDGMRRFTFYAMPHIAISQAGEIGKVYREGLQQVSHACGALDAIVHELACGHLKLEMDMQDIEQTIVRQKILSTLTYGAQPNLVEITKLACQIISHDVEHILDTLDTTIFNYAVMTGIQIHGPMDTTWISPHRNYVVGQHLPDGKVDISLL
jgi:hypothetical protein